MKYKLMKEPGSELIFNDKHLDIHYSFFRMDDKSKTFEEWKDSLIEVDPTQMKCRVYFLNWDCSGRGHEICINTYEEARKVYDKYKELGQYVELQAFQYRSDLGVETFEDTLDQRYYDGYEAYCEQMDADDDWRPGDAPWEAPGMSISDFF